MAKPRNQRPYNVAYYRRERDREIARVRERQAATLALLRDLRQVPCADCGGRFAPHQMDFDHRDPATKSFHVMTGGAMLASRGRLMAEVDKCDVVCANCHRIRTHARAVSLPPTQRSTVPATTRHRARWRDQAAVLNGLRAVPCADCGGRFPSCAMDFDHREPDEKVQAVSQMVSRAGIMRILAEVAKCDIVCANCHRARTFERRRQVAERE